MSEPDSVQPATSDDPSDGFPEQAILHGRRPPDPTPRDSAPPDSTPPTAAPTPSDKLPLLLYLNVFVIATCGLVYELLAATAGSYYLGDSVKQFSLVIGIYLSALGAGAWLSRGVENVARCFVEVEFGVAILGGCLAPVLFLSFAKLDPLSASLFLYSAVFAVGALVGAELPLLMRLLKDQLEFKDLVSRVLTFDYIGCLLAAVLFPLLLVPSLGLVRTSLVFGLLNAAVGLWGTWLLRPMIKGGVAGLRIRGVIACVILIAGLLNFHRITTLLEAELYSDRIIYATSSHYQRIVITRNQKGFQLFLNRNLQFASHDEYRYHEALVHPAMAAHPAPKRVLVLGGGDGLALREIFRYAGVEHATIVDLDEEMTNLSTTFPLLAELNENAFRDPRLTVINQDAMIWLEEPTERFDVVIIDFPDPRVFAIGKLYTTRFYRMLRDRMNPDAVVSIQCTSPMMARKSYWCILRTMEAAGFTVRPYHVATHSFGIWGYALASLRPFDVPAKTIDGLKFLNDQTLAAMFVLPVDLGPVDVEINRLDNQALVRYYEREWD